MSFSVFSVSIFTEVLIFIYIIWTIGLFPHRDHMRDQELTVKAKTSEQLVYFHTIHMRESRTNGQDNKRFGNYLSHPQSSSK